MEPQRPPSSRPRSSKPGVAGRPKTAGRNADRPLTSAIANRSVSRVGTTAGSGSAAVAERPASRGVSSLGVRPTSRLMTGSTTAAGPRPGSRSIPLVSDRPITQQQGMGGVRAVTRMGTGAGRQIADKSYYLALLNRQLAALEAEIEALSVEMERTERDQQNLAAYEQRAEEQANELKELQGELADYNMIIDKQNANADLLRELEFELGEVSSSNKEISLIVEQTFKERKEKEDQARELEAEMSRQKTESAVDVDIEGGNMTPDEREEYVRVRSEWQNVQQQVAEKNQQLETLLTNKDEMDMLLGNSALKQQAIALNDQLYNFEERERALKTAASQTNKETSGEQSTESLIGKIRADNEEIEEMQHLLEQVQERIGQAEEELAEFRNESQLLHGERSEKFRELKNRDAHMEHFFDAFPANKKELEESISKLSAAIVRLLQLISINCRHTDNMGGGVDESALSFGGDNVVPGVTASELQDLHLRLQEELVTLDANESALHLELDGMKRKQEEIDATKDQLNDLEGRREELAARKKELEERRRELTGERAKLEGENGRALEQVDANERRLSENTNYSKMKDLKRRNETDEEERKEVRAKLAQRAAEYHYENVKQEALRLRAQYNLLLVASASDQ